MSQASIPVKCCRCRHKHTEADRVAKPRKEKGAVAALRVDEMVCPRCGCATYYDESPQVAWCWASGLIEIGDALPKASANGGGAIEIARGPKAYLKGRISVLARHGQGASAGKLLVPGVPEADSEAAKSDALAVWLTWCNKRRSRDGVSFSQEALG